MIASHMKADQKLTYNHAQNDFCTEMLVEVAFGLWSMFVKYIIPSLSILFTFLFNSRNVAVA
jgi:hypothetical protein